MSSEVDSIAAQIVSELEQLADPTRREGELKYFKNTINNLGVTLPQLQSVERGLCKSLVKTWTLDQAMELCDKLLALRVFEVTLCALTFLDRFSDQMTPAEFARCEKWLADDLCDNWAAVDHLCPHVLGTTLGNHPELASRLRAWTGSDNRWLRRGSAVTLILPARTGAFLDLAYEIAASLIEDKTDDLVQKGNGWLLRECGMTDPDRLEQFLFKRGPDIPRTTLRYAIEKFPADRRAQLLAATRR